MHAGVVMNNFNSGCMGFVWLHAEPVLHRVASPFHSFVTITSTKHYMGSGPDQCWRGRTDLIPVGAAIKDGAVMTDPSVLKACIVPNAACFRMSQELRTDAVRHARACLGLCCSSAVPVVTKE